MKEKLKNSLQLLSDAIDDLSGSISSYQAVRAQRHNAEVELYRAEQKKSLDEIARLRGAYESEHNKVVRALGEVKDLSISLKNKMNQF